ncbi:MAG: hypothetical protein ABI200_03965 [Gaiellales bacterium]
MNDAATSTALPAAAVAPKRTFRSGVRDVVVCSLLVTIAAALVALAIAQTTDARWSLVFVISRWLCVAILLATPLLHQIAVRFGAKWRMPWVFATPATALLLTVESIAFDILSARLG